MQRFSDTQFFTVHWRKFTTNPILSTVQIFVLLAVITSYVVFNADLTNLVISDIYLKPKVLLCKYIYTVEKSLLIARLTGTLYFLL